MNEQQMIAAGLLMMSGMPFNAALTQALCYTPDEIDLMISDMTIADEARRLVEERMVN